MNILEHCSIPLVLLAKESVYQYRKLYIGIFIIIEWIEKKHDKEKDCENDIDVNI